MRGLQSFRHKLREISPCNRLQFQPERQQTRNLKPLLLTHSDSLAAFATVFRHVSALRTAVAVLTPEITVAVIVPALLCHVGHCVLRHFFNPVILAAFAAVLLHVHVEAHVFFAIAHSGPVSTKDFCVLTHLSRGAGVVAAGVEFVQLEYVRPGEAVSL